MSDDKAKDRIRKLLELARRGVGGEAKTAARFLSKALAKHGLTMADIEDEDEQAAIHWFTFKTDQERRLLFSTVAMVLDERELSYYNAGKRKAGFSLTRSQHAEVVMAWTVYKRELAAHLDRAFVAFICANGIGSRKPSDADKDAKMDPAEWALLNQMIAGTKRVTVRKAIGMEAKP